MQTQNYKNPMYKSTYDCFVKIVKKNSVRGLYRGMSSPMAGVAAVNAIVFGVYGNVQRSASNPNSLLSHFCAGTAAGLVQSVVCSPMELVKTRIQLQTGNQYKSPLDCFLQIRRVEGIRGVFRGLGITAMRDMPGFSSYFVSYELMTRNSVNPSALHTLLAGGCAGTLSWLFTFPIDVIKSRLQADGMTGPKLYTGIADCVRKGYNAEGIMFFSRGLTSTLIRAFPMNAACFLVVSYVMKLSQVQTMVEVDIHQPEAMAVIGSVTAPFVIPIKHYEPSHHKTRTIRNFVLSSAFHEAVCQDEIAELAHEVYEDRTSYYRWVEDDSGGGGGGSNSNDHLPLKFRMFSE